MAYVLDERMDNIYDEKSFLARRWGGFAEPGVQVSSSSVTPSMFRSRV